MTTAQLLDDSATPYAQLLKAAADELRLAILQVLAQDSYGVLELAQAFQMKQSGMSHHLKVLTTAGLLVTRREGNSIFYRRAAIAPDDPFANTKLALYQHMDCHPVPLRFQDGLKRVWHERAQASQQFFVENADKFKAQQDLIANIDVYQKHVAELLDMSPLKSHRHALEIGPGQGEFLSELAGRFKAVTAIDNSQQMLKKTQAWVAEHKLHNVNLILGDTEHLKQQDTLYDCAVINMVLHHTPSPAQIFADVSAVLQPQAVLLVTELSLHDQNWTQEACGDIWLGFAPEDLTTWASEAHFMSGQSVYFALRNGFQIQIHQFIKQPC